MLHNFNSFETDSVLSVLPSNQYIPQDYFEIINPANFWCYPPNTNKMPSVFCSWYGSAAALTVDYTSTFFAGLGTIVKFASASDWTYERVSGEYRTVNPFSDFPGRKGVAFPASNAIFTAGVITAPAKALVVDIDNLIFFIPDGYALYVDGADNHTVLDRGYFVIMKSSSATYGGVPYTSLSNACAISKWDYSYRFGRVTSGQLSEGNDMFPYLPVFVDGNDFVSVLSSVGNAEQGSGSSPVLFSCLLHMSNDNDPISCVPDICQSYGKKLVCMSSGVSKVPYFSVNVL